MWSAVSLRDWIRYIPIGHNITVDSYLPDFSSICTFICFTSQETFGYCYRFDGQLIYPYMTAAQLEMEDGDIIGKSFVFPKDTRIATYA